MAWNLSAAEIPLMSARLVLEPLRVEHAALLYEDLADPLLYRYVPEEPPRCIADLERRYETLSRRRSPQGTDAWLNWAMRLRGGGAYVGTLQATVSPRGRALIAYLVFVRSWGQGLGREGCARMLRSLASDFAAARADAEIDTRNLRSIRLVEALGFRRVATRTNVAVFKGAESHEHLYRAHLPLHTSAHELKERC